MCTVYAVDYHPPFVCPFLFPPSLLLSSFSPSSPYSAAEAIHVANMLARHGFFFSVEGLGIPVRDDGTLYRFQVNDQLATMICTDYWKCTSYWDLQIIGNVQFVEMLPSITAPQDVPKRLVLQVYLC